MVVSERPMTVSNNWKWRCPHLRYSVTVNSASTVSVIAASTVAINAQTSSERGDSCRARCCGSGLGV